MGEPVYDYRWRVRARLPERFGQACRVVVSGRLNSILVEFADGFRVVTSRHYVRRIKPMEVAKGTGAGRVEPLGPQVEVALGAWEQECKRRGGEIARLEGELEAAREALRARDALERVRRAVTLRVRPGDVLALEVPADTPLSAHMVERIRVECRAVLPNGVRTIILCGMTAKVITTAEADAAIAAGDRGA